MAKTSPTDLAKVRKYQESVKGKATLARYKQTDVFKLSSKKARARYQASAKGKAANRRNRLTYKGTPAGRQAVRRALHTYETSEHGRRVIHAYRTSPRRHLQDRNARIKRTYGLTPEQYEEMAASQNHVCAICAEKNTFRHRLVIDHDHKTGKVRGLLCDPCNLVLGYLEDSLETLSAVSVYLSKHASQAEPAAALDYQI